MRRLAMIVMAAALAGSVALAQDVKSDFDKAADFSKIKTFQVKIGTAWGNQISEQRFVTQFEQTLSGKGWKKVDSNPDALVVLHGATSVKKSLNTFYSDMGGYGGYGYRGGWGGGMGMGTATTTESEFTVGTLVVDIFDASTKKLMFRGQASDEVSDKPEKNLKKITKAAEKMFKNFPPGSAKK